MSISSRKDTASTEMNTPPSQELDKAPLGRGSSSPSPQSSADPNASVDMPIADASSDNEDEIYNNVELPDISNVSTDAEESDSENPSPQEEVHSSSDDDKHVAGQNGTQPKPQTPMSDRTAEKKKTNTPRSHDHDIGFKRMFIPDTADMSLDAISPIHPPKHKPSPITQTMGKSLHNRTETLDLPPAAKRDILGGSISLAGLSSPTSSKSIGLDALNTNLGSIPITAPEVGFRSPLSIKAVHLNVPNIALGRALATDDLSWKEKLNQSAVFNKSYVAPSFEEVLEKATSEGKLDDPSFTQNIETSAQLAAVQAYTNSIPGFWLNYIQKHKLYEAKTEEDAESFKVKAWANYLVRHQLFQNILIKNELIGSEDLFPRKQNKELWGLCYQYALKNLNNKVKPTPIAVYDTLESSERSKAKKAFNTAIIELKKKVNAEVKSGAMDDASAYELMSETVALVEHFADLDKSTEKTIDLNDPKSRKPTAELRQDVLETIVNFQNNTKKFQTNWSWRAILGAVIGAAIGFAVGAMVGIWAGPMAALTAVLGAYQGAVMMGSLLGAGAATLAGTSLGLLATRASDKVRNTTHASKDLVLTYEEPAPVSIPSTKVR